MFLKIVPFLVVATIFGCERSDKNTSVKNDESTTDIAIASEQERAEIAAPKILDILSGKAVKTGVGSCDAQWARSALGQTVLAVEQPVTGVIVTFEKEEDLIQFAQASLVLGSMYKTQFGDAYVCGELGASAVPE